MTRLVGIVLLCAVLVTMAVVVYTRMVREHYAHLIEFDQAPDLTFL